MSNTVIRPKDRAEWLEYRKDGIGSSEVTTTMGLNPPNQCTWEIESMCCDRYLNTGATAPTN